ncbi:MAG: hypothetical protein JSV68_00055, partial [Anaerolineaceae bacterium]
RPWTVVTTSFHDTANGQGSTRKDSTRIAEAAKYLRLGGFCEGVIFWSFSPDFLGNEYSP